MKQQKIVFVGSHLSVQRGTKGISEKIADLLGDKYDISLVSRHENRIFRLLDIIYTLGIKRFHIVHIDVFSNKGFIYANLASLIAKIKKEPVLMTLRGGMLTEKFEREPKHVRTVLERANVLQSPSLFLIDFFEKQGINIDHMPNFIDIERFPFSRNKVQSHNILWVRAFSSEYRPELAVDTLYKVLQQYPDATLTMIGPDKGQLANTIDLAQQLGIKKRIKFEGKVANEKLFRYFQSHAVYLNTTAYESFGVAVLEAASCGIPIVSTNVGEIPYMWEENEELLMSSAHAEAFAEKVGMIFSSNELSKKLSQNAHSKAIKYDWNTIRPKWDTLFNRMMNRGK